MMVNGQLVGLVTDKVREMMARARIDYRIVMLPWLRAYSMAQTQPNHCVFNTAHTPDRDKLFKWVEPTNYADWTPFGLATRKFDIDTLGDARRYVIGTYNVLEACRRSEARLALVGTCMVYDTAGREAISETHPTKPASPSWASSPGLEGRDSAPSPGWRSARSFGSRRWRSRPSPRCTGGASPGAPTPPCPCLD